MDEDVKVSVGYKRPPPSTRFQKGRSGNPNGRPRNRVQNIPHDVLLGHMVTIRDDGRERKVTAAEAFLLQLTKKGLEGCGASARASLASIQNARAAHQSKGNDFNELRIRLRSFGLCCIVEDLGMAVRVNESDKERVRLELKPWIVEQALSRMAPDLLSAEEQRIVLKSTRTPKKVQWPDWWVVRP